MGTAPDIVDKTIGNSSWTNLVCDDCKQDVDVVVRVGEPQGYESSTADLCVSCAKAAYDLIRGRS